jgi:gluconokinase
MPTEAERTQLPDFVPSYVLVMGVSGVGKSTVGRAIAEQLQGPFIEADEHHPPENIRLMSAGTPLTDVERWPWLAAIAKAAASDLEQKGGPVVIACSALKRRYRDFLREALGSLAIVHLAGPRDLIRERMKTRQGHFMPPQLLDSQLADLEELAPDEDGITVSIAEAPEHLVELAVKSLRDSERGTA